MVERALKSRRNQPMLLVDIAVPRDIEPEVGKLANAYLYSVDDLHSPSFKVILPSAKRQPFRLSILCSRKVQLYGWLRAQGAVETIRDYRSQADQMRAEAEAEALAAIAQGADVESVIHKLAHRLTNRLFMHQPNPSSRPRVTATSKNCRCYVIVSDWIKISSSYYYI
jgi:glutamyl-tRNA reductase